MQEMPNLPQILDKPISDKGIESVLIGAVEAYPLETLLSMLIFMSLIAFFGYRLVRLFMHLLLINSTHARDSQERISKLTQETKRHELEVKHESKKRRANRRR